jgi:hypothetical protein
MVHLQSLKRWWFAVVLVACIRNMVIIIMLPSSSCHQLSSFFSAIKSGVRSPYCLSAAHVLHSACSMYTVLESICKQRKAAGQRLHWAHDAAVS